MSLFSVIFFIILAAFSAWYLLKPRKSSRSEKDCLVDVEKHMDLLLKRLAEFKPKPLTETINEIEKLNISDLIETVSKPDTQMDVIIEGKKKTLINFGSIDFLGYSTDKRVVEDKAKEALLHYGCGSCGPRGFYGTFDVHLILEKKLATFFGTDGCIVYSDSFTTVPSVLGAFIDKSDIIVADEQVGENFLNGMYLTRASVKFFKHCDMKSCEEVLQEVSKSKERVFLVTESVFRRTGKKTDIKKLVELRAKYTVRLHVDESFAFGSCGKTGRGLWEEQNVPVSQIDFLTCSLDNVCASIGGFCVGSKAITDHQRLMGAGYCFSAAVAPVLSAVAVLALDLMIAEPAKIKSLRDNILLLRNGFVSKELEIISSVESPLTILQLKKRLGGKLEEGKRLRQVAKEIRDKGYLVVCTALTPSEIENPDVFPTLKISISAKHTKSQIQGLLKVLA